MRKGKHTKRNVWDDAAELEIWRGGEKLDPGVNYFVLMLDQMELPTAYSCEGHPGGFYVTFNGSYEQALAIKQAGFFAVEIEDDLYWSIRKQTVQSPSDRVDALRWAAQAWEERFGPLDWDAVKLSI
jgi:hypothetical protein